MKDYKKMRTRLLLIFSAIFIVFIVLSLIMIEKNLIVAIILFLIPIVVAGPILARFEYKYFRCPHCDRFIGNKNSGDYCQYCGKSLYEAIDKAKIEENKN